MFDAWVDLDTLGISGGYLSVLTECQGVTPPYKLLQEDSGVFLTPGAVFLERSHDPLDSRGVDSIYPRNPQTLI